jgi:MoxR-like ATPase
MSTKATGVDEILKGVKPLVETGLLERHGEDKVLSLALLLGEHVLFVGTKGTAKSLHATEAFRRLDGRKFSTHLTKESTEEDIFGPLSVPAYRAGRLEREWKDTLLDCDFAYIEEGFDARDGLLRAMLGVLNERRYWKGSLRLDEIPLRTAVVTANYVRLNEVTDAFIDRFLFKWGVEPVRAKEHLLGWEPVPSPQVLTSAQIDAMREKVGGVEFPADIRKLAVFVAKKCGLSDRTLVRSGMVLRAAALLAGRREVEWPDLYAFVYINGMTDADKAATLKWVDEATKDIRIAATVQKQMRQLDEWRKAVDAAGLDMAGAKLLNSLKKEVEPFVPADEVVATKKNDLVAVLTEKCKQAQTEAGISS